MKKTRKPFLVCLIAITLFVFACVTINIYFPAEQVESVAEDIVDDIRGDNGGSKDESSGYNRNPALYDRLLAALCPVAWAQEVMTVSNPTIRALKEKMKGRYNRMKPFYQQGRLKEGSNGYVSVANTEGLGLKEKRDLNNLVGAENDDRKTLYAEVAKALNIDPSLINKVAETFAREWQESVQ